MEDTTILGRDQNEHQLITLSNIHTVKRIPCEDKDFHSMSHLQTERHPLKEEEEELALLA